MELQMTGPCVTQDTYINYKNIWVAVLQCYLKKKSRANILSLITKHSPMNKQQT